MATPKLKSAFEAANEVAPPAPITPEPLPDFALDPVTVKSRACTVGTHEPEGIASRLIQAETHQALDWLAAWRPEEAALIRREQFSLRDRALENSKRLTLIVHAGRELQNECMHRANLRQQLRDVEAELARAKSTLASPGALDLPDAELLRLKLQTDHLPAKAKETSEKIAASTAKVEKLAKESGCDRKLFLAEMVRDGQAARLHAHGHLKL